MSNASQIEADCILKLLLKYGVNHIDVTAAYGNAEKRIGPWMKQHRDDFFLTTKSRSRSYNGAWKDLQKSLDRLRVDQIDMWQMHGLTNPVSWEKVMAPRSALEAFIEARDEGLVRFLGVTGHGDKAPSMHKQSLERFDFDSVMLPYNYLQMKKTKYANDFIELVKMCRENRVALQTIKSTVRRPWGSQIKTHNTYFYEPLEEQEAIDKSVHWALGLTESFVITAGDIQILPKILEAATRFEGPPSESEMSAIVDEYSMQTIRCSNVDFR